MIYIEDQNGEFNLDYGILVKTVEVDRVRIENKMKKTKKKNSFKHWATGLRS